MTKNTQLFFSRYERLFFSIAIVFTFTILMPTSIVYAQKLKKEKDLRNDKEDTDYRHKPWKGNNAFLKKYLESINYFADKNKVRYLVPIHFWIYKDSNGEGGASLSDIDKFINDLNYYNRINHTGFQFYVSNIREIHKTRRKILGYYLEAPLQGIFRHKKRVINVHIVDGFKLRKGVRKLVRGTYNYISKSIMLRRENSSTGLSHEVGHYFGLLHPHRNYNKGKNKQEPISRVRTKEGSKNTTALCELRGDYLADTPAEPKLTFLVNNDCKFVGTSLKDCWGDHYKSNTNNIMSYPSNYYCRNNFTMGQIGIMLYTAASNKNAKYWNADLPQNKTYALDATEPNDYFEMASPIKLDTSYTLNFHKILVNKRKNKTDTCDWYKFEIKDYNKPNVRILLNLNNNLKRVSVTLYDKNKIMLKEFNGKSSEPIELEYKNLVEDWYFVRVTYEGTNSKQLPYEYVLKIENNNY